MPPCSRTPCSPYSVRNRCPASAGRGHWVTLVLSPWALRAQGEIALLIRSNGAYRNSDVKPDDARAMSRSFVDVLSDGTPESLLAYRTHEFWADWFCDVAWDVTLVVLDASRRRWWLVCVTDTD